MSSCLLPLIKVFSVIPKFLKLEAVAKGLTVKFAVDKLLLLFTF